VLLLSHGNQCKNVVEKLRFSRTVLKTNGQWCKANFSIYAAFQMQFRQCFKSFIDWFCHKRLFNMSLKKKFSYEVLYQQFRMNMTKKEHVWNCRTSINDTKNIIQYIVHRLSSYRLKNSCYFSFPFLHKFAPWRDIDFQNVAIGQWFK